MILEWVIYEVVTTAGSFLGFKMLTGNRFRRLKGLNLPKQVPVIDNILKNKIGVITKREKWLANKAAKTINRISQYEAFKLLLVLAGRSVHAKAIQNRKRSTNSVRGVFNGGRTVSA